MSLAAAGRVRAWLATGLALGALAACGAQPQRIVVGVALSRAYHQGVEMAVDEINAGGGINGVPVELEGLDWVVVDNYDPRDAIGWAKHFAAIDDLGHRLDRVPFAQVAQDLSLVFHLGIAQRQTDEEAVKLGLWQGKGALILDGVLCSQHQEGLGQRASVSTNRDLLL